MADPVSTPEAIRGLVAALERILDGIQGEPLTFDECTNAVRALAAWRSRVKLADDNAFGEYFDREVLTLLDARLSGKGD